MARKVGKKSSTRTTRKRTTRARYNNKSYRYRKNSYSYKYPGVGKAIGSSLGSFVPGVGSYLGGLAGDYLQQGIKTITGHGDYTVRQNSVVYNRDAVPEFATMNPRCTILAHSEFIKDIRGSTTFQMDSFDINATNPACFPWLSQVAKNYEQVVWQGLVFQFKTTCANAVASTNTALGTVVMSTQYDSLSPLFTNKQQMENYEFSQSSVPSASLMHPIECDPKLTLNQGLFYTDNPANSNLNADPRLYNIGRFNIATVGMQAAATIGELWVTYKVCLLKPKMNAQVNWADHWVLDASSINASNPFGTNPYLSTTSSSYQAQYMNGNTVNNPSDQQMSNLIVSPWGSGSNTYSCIINPSFSGKLLVIYQLHGGSVPKVDPTVVAFGNARIDTLPANAPLGGFVTYSKLYENGLSADNTLFAFVVSVQGGYGPMGFPPGFDFSGGNPNAPTYGNLCIYSIPSNISN